MRPATDPATDLTQPVQFAKGVGPHRAEQLARLGVKTVADLLFLFPRRYQDFSNLQTISELVVDQPASVYGEVVEFEQAVSGSGKTVFYLLVRQESDYLRAIWFNQPHLRERFQVGQRLVLRGTPRKSTTRWEMIHPKTTWLTPGQQPERGELLPIYPLTAGLDQNGMRRMLQQIIAEHAGHLPEVFPSDYLSSRELCPIVEAVHNIHFPAAESALEAARRRLIYQELLVLQLALAMRRDRVRSGRNAAALPLDERIRSRIERRFPFALSPSQRQAVQEIASDMGAPVPMNRLLHGDVGSGKTAVATYAMLLAVAHGYSAVLMTPTEILARQHVRTLKNLLRASRVRVGYCGGGQSAAEKQQLQESIEAGDVDILVGTSAVIYGDFQFSRLALVVIDEQHKFGVRQRARLRHSGLDPHYLVMTATPIPRTIALTVFGDLDISRLERRTDDTAPTHTYLALPEQQPAWWEFFRRKLREGRQGFVIAPRVDDQQNDAGVEQVYESLVNDTLADFRLDLLHGRQSPEEQEAAMLAFERGNTQVLVATSVVEVGIDLPNAAVMSILSPQRFGLSQLHQLRGRVGRGRFPGYVALLADPETPETTQQRLQAFADTSDGFAIAELDFQTRGPGEILGTKQHGIPALRIADLFRDQEILEQARTDARQLIETDPQLTAAQWNRLRRLVLGRYGKLLELGDVG